MCGRYVSPDEAAIERMWRIGRDSPNPFAGLTPFGRRYNVTPTTKVAVIQRDRDKEQLVLTEARWGLIPHWWKEKTLPRFTINSRSEEAQTKPMWRGPYRHWRCLIPAEGWYEWPIRPPARSPRSVNHTLSLGKIGSHFVLRGCCHCGRHRPAKRPFCLVPFLRKPPRRRWRRCMIACQSFFPTRCLSAGPTRHFRMPTR